MSVLFIPWLGETLFYSKGEPREAIVAVSMLDSGDWILPVSYGEDMPYKPPFLAWLIALCSLIFNGGTVNEFTSRLPSAVAAVALLVATWRLLAPTYGRRRAWLVMIITATMFEFFRASEACRVDMVLTACMLGGAYAIFTARPTDRLRLLWGVLLFSGATLTKGPVGTLLPCLALGIYYLLRGENFFRTLLKFTVIALASFVIPAVWYWLAYRQGGASFAELAWEENIGRLTGTMSYDSHINPWYYNVTSVLAGGLPWTVPVIIALCYRRVRRILRTIKLDGGLPMFAWTMGLTIFVFYCFPASKRSVYLLPCYPFIAYGISWVLNQVRETRLMSVWAMIMAVIAIVAPIVMMVMQYVPSGSLTLAPVPWYLWPVSILPVLAGGWWLSTRSRSASGVAGATGLTLVVLIAYNAVFMPMVMNPRSDAEMAKVIQTKVPDDADIVSIIDEDSLLRYYSLNFYMNDRLRRSVSEADAPSGAWILTSTPSDTTRAVLLSKRSADTRRPVYLVSPK